MNAFNCCVKVKCLIGRGSSFFVVGRDLERAILVVVQKQQQLISLSLATGLVQFQLVAELTLKDCGEKRGAERESYTWQGKGVLREIQIGLVGAVWDEC